MFKNNTVFFNKTIMQNDNDKFVLAKQLHLKGKIKEAQKIYINLSKKYKQNHTLYHSIGTTFLQLKNYHEAIVNLEKSISLNSNLPDSHNNLGIALAEIKNYSEALNCYNKAILLKDNYVDAYLNRGISNNKLRNYYNAIKDFNFVIKAQPNNIKAYNNLGNVFKNLQKYDEAIEQYNKAININEFYLEAISNKGDTLFSQNKFDEALIEYKNIYSKKPEFLGLYQKIINTKMIIFDWENYYEFADSFKKKILKKEIFVDTLYVFYLFDDPKLHKITTENYINNKFKDYKKIDLKRKNIKNKKIKIGYFSGDFHNHPVLHLMTNIYKYHNKTNFELYAFSHGPRSKNNIWKDSIINYFKKFYDIYGMSDEEVIRLVNDENIDIAVNLSGLTDHSRTSIFFNRVAPIQVNYLGYLGTIGLKSMDYIICDKIVIPENQKKNYTEEVSYLPKCYIPCSNNIMLKNSGKKFSRSDFNLPENLIVFCAFHNPRKINPAIFDVWINILKKTGDSVLWIKSDNKVAEKNLLNEVTKRGINKKRIIFTKEVENINDHIEKLRLADIFLDTYPYNSHSTIYDYFKAGLPAIVRNGSSFPSRGASTIYSSMGLTELIAKDDLDYSNIAIDLANNKSKIKKIKTKIKNGMKNNYIFDSEKFTQDLEKLYLEMYNKR